MSRRELLRETSKLLQLQAEAFQIKPLNRAALLHSMLWYHHTENYPVYRINKPDGACTKTRKKKVSSTYSVVQNSFCSVVLGHPGMWTKRATHSQLHGINELVYYKT